MPHGDDRPWRVRAATRAAFGDLIPELFPDDSAADRALVRAWPTMFAYQFVFELVPRGHGATR